MRERASTFSTVRQTHAGSCARVRTLTHIRTHAARVVTGVRVRVCLSHSRSFSLSLALANSNRLTRARTRAHVRTRARTHAHKLLSVPPPRTHTHHSATQLLQATAAASYSHKPDFIFSLSFASLLLVTHATTQLHHRGPIAVINLLAPPPSKQHTFGYSFFQAAMENSSTTLPPPASDGGVITATAPTATAAKRRHHRGFGGYSRRRVTAAAKNRERQAPIEECHVNSLSGLTVPLLDGVSQVTFEYYLGEHQSQIFYGGLNISQPGKRGIRVELGRPIPIDLREDYNQDGQPPMPCLAVPTHIFRRFRVYRITSSSSCDLKKLAASLTNDGGSPDESDASCPPTGEKLPSIFPSTTPKSGLSLISLRVYYPVQYMQSANELHPVPGSRKRVHFYPVSHFSYCLTNPSHPTPPG